MSSWRTVCAMAALVPALAATTSRPAMAVTLDDVLRDVAAQNPALGADYEMAVAARERVSPAGAWTAPVLELGVANVPTSGKFDQDMMTMKVIALRQRVPLWGANGLARRSANEAALAADSRTRDARNLVFGEAVARYAAAWAAGERTRSAEDHLEVLRRAVGSAEARYAAGTTRLDEVLRARAEEARARGELATYREEERAARIALGAVRGRAPAFEEETLEPPPSAPVAADPAVWLGAVDESHPRLVAADAEAARWRDAASAARRTTWPDLEVMAEYDFRETLADGMPQDDMFGARVGFALPVFSGSREGSEGAEMDAMARAADHERRGAALELLQQVALAHANARAAEIRARLLADTIVTAGRAALESAWSAYAAGTLELPRVLDVAHALYADEIELTRAREAIVEAEARGVALTGHGALAGIALPGPEVRP